MKFEFKFPDIGEGLDEGVIMKWMVKEGDEIKEGDSVVEVETDKVTAEIPSPKTGKVLELKAEKGDTIHVGNVFIVIEVEGEASDEAKDAPTPDPKENIGEKEEVKDELDEKQEVVEEETAGVVGEVIASSEVIAPSTEEHVSAKKIDKTEKVLATPVARQMAKDMGVDIGTVKGTGPNGRVMKEDIQNAKGKVSQQKVEEKAPAKAVSHEVSSDERVERIPLTKIRKTIAERMSQSRFTIPHTTAMDEIDITKLDEFRKKYKDVLVEEDVNLTYLPFITKAVIVALKQFPEFNSELDEENGELILKHFYNIGIATDTDRGLMVPVVKDVDRLSVVEIAKAIENVTTKAKENKISINELRGGTFSITNYGSIGGHFGIPIINYPEAAILGLGRVVKKPIVRDDEIVIAKVLPLSLSYDHRTIDGASGSRFLNVMKELLSDPDMLFLKS